MRLGDVPVPAGRLHWRAQGDPADPAIVLLPKLGGWVDDLLPMAVQLASQGYHVIGIDPPGHGDSVMEDEPPWAQPMDASAHMVALALRDLAVERPIIGGNSLGGCIALATAALFPDLARGLVLISCATGPAMTEEDLRRHQAAHPDPDFTADGAPRPRDFQRMATINGNLDPAVHAAMERSRQRAGRWIQPSERGVALADFPSMLARISVPALLVYGDRESLGQRFGPRRWRHWATGVPCSRSRMPAAFPTRNGPQPRRPPWPAGPQRCPDG